MTERFGNLKSWIGASLRRRLVVVLSLVLVVASLVFLGMFVGIYSNRLAAERSAVSMQVNQLLQVSLENAMLKRDIPGLRRIVERLGQQEQVMGVTILNPTGEVRFASDRSRIGEIWSASSGDLCPDCEPAEMLAPVAVFTDDQDGRAILRSVNAVQNQAPCVTCHGPIGDNPVNGVLVVDYDGQDIKNAALQSTLALSGSGLVVLAAGIGAIWFALRSSVLQPLGQLTDASRDLAKGVLSTRIGYSGDDELAELSRDFDHMASALETGHRQLEHRERFLQALIDAVPDGIRLIDRNFKVKRANRAYLDQVGLPPDQVIGQPCYASSHKRTTPCPATLVTCPLHEFGQGALPLTCRHQHIRGDDNQPFMVEVSANSLDVETPDGRERLVIESIRDLSKEMAISHEQKLSELGLLAAGVAHEIRNPLASMRFGLQAIRQGVDVEGNGEMLEHLQLVDDEIEECITVTERLLKLSTPPSDQPELVSIDHIVDDVLSLLNAEAEANHIDVRIEIEPCLRVIAADADMRMLVFNLAQNAFHAMPKGGRLSIEGRKIEDFVHLAFSDDGVGIRPDDLPKIFDPFWSRRADDVRGTGLGLSICRAIVERCHGRFEVTSHPDEGSRFLVIMPSADVASAVA